MNYEDKYKSTLERAREFQKSKDGLCVLTAESIFPELQECEDERIRKELIFYLGDMPEDTELRNGITNRDVLAWLEKQGEKKPIMNIPTREVILAIWDLGNEWKELTNGSISTKYGTQLDYIQKHWHESEYYLREKQGEQKVPINDFKAKNWYVSEVDGKIHDMTYNPADKVEPKFKVGDWIITKDKNVHKDYSVCKIVEIENNRYHLENGDYLDIDTLEQYDYRLWTIQDAKDGDILATENFIFIFKNIDDGNGVHYYCQYEISKHEDDNQFDIALPQSLMGRVGNSIIHYSPATKEQRDLLFQKMKEAGYQWNPDKKELKLLISNGGDFESNNSKQKTTWSENDERIVTALMEGFRYHQLFNPRFGEIPNAEIIDWIKSLKERLS